MNKHAYIGFLIALAVAGLAGALGLPETGVKILATLSFGSFFIAGLSAQLRSMRSDDFEIKSSPNAQALLATGALALGVLIGVAVLINA